MDVAALEKALRTRIEREVRFDVGSRGTYATDASNYRQVLIGWSSRAVRSRGVRGRSVRRVRCPRAVPGRWDQAGRPVHRPRAQPPHHRPNFPTNGLAAFADHEDPEVRALAEAEHDPETEPTTVERLTRDPGPAVRAELARPAA